MSKEDAPLTELQKNFVEYYLLTLNATEAAIKAGYSASSARVKGSQLLAKVNVAAAIAERRKTKLAEIALDTDRILEEITAISFSNFFDVAYMNDKDELQIKKPADIPPHALKAIKRIVSTTRTVENDRNSTTTTTVSLEMVDKMRGLEFLGRYFGMQDGKGNGDEGTGSAGDSSARTSRVLEAARRIARSRGESAG